MSTLVISALGVFYFALSEIWNLPYGKQVSDTSTELVALISSVLGANTFYQLNRKRGAHGIHNNETN